MNSLTTNIEIDQAVKDLIQRYKTHIKETRLEDEIYKWKLIKQFYGRPNLEAADFANEITSIDYSNLVYHIAPRVIAYVADHASEEYREAFKGLFNEDIALSTRVKEFSTEVLRIYREVEPEQKFGHYHDERTVATMLTYRYPEKFTFYKASFYKAFCNLLGIAPAKTGERYLHYLELINDLIANYIEKDEELLTTFQGILTEDCFEDRNHKILAQDILYQMLDKNEKSTKSVAGSETEPTFWFVCQGRSLSDDRGKRYLFAPNQGSDGRKTPHWDAVRKVKKGDIIFNYADKAIRGISFAKESSRPSINPKPKEGGNNEGNIVDIEFFDLDPPIDYLETLDISRDLQRVTQGINSPFDVNGRIKQGYLFEFNRRGAEILRRAYDNPFPEPLESLLSLIDQQIPLDMKYSINTILYGPPGTGKTYNSIDKAVEIVSGRSADHATNKQKFDEFRQLGQIEFITFHQNYAYEDFVVGIRPDVENDQLRFQIQKGIFYHIARRARENYEASLTGRSFKRSFDEVFADLIEPLERDDVVEIIMASGGTFRITEVTDTSIHFDKQSGSSKHTLSISTLRDTVDGLRDLRTNGLRPYYFPLVKLIRERRESGQTRTERKNYVLIIDEINRANISKVFGELITLLEIDKRLGGENELRVTLPTGEKDFAIPPNLYVLGTMNTADKSIALIDIALRRRFEFIGYYPQYDHLPEDVAELLKTINSQIFAKKKSADYLIGHAYFMGDDPIESVLKKKVIPLLVEYFAGKTEIISDIFSNTIWAVSYNTESFVWDISKR